jgi:hypothetical protein
MGNKKGNIQNDSVMTENKAAVGLRGVIDLVDNMKDAGLEKYITLPRIVVVGTQSSGKSSSKSPSLEISPHTSPNTCLLGYNL